MSLICFRSSKWNWQHGWNWDIWHCSKCLFFCCVSIGKMICFMFGWYLRWIWRCLQMQHVDSHVLFLCLSPLILCLCCVFQVKREKDHFSMVYTILCSHGFVNVWFVVIYYQQRISFYFNVFASGSYKHTFCYISLVYVAQAKQFAATCFQSFHGAPNFGDWQNYTWTVPSISSRQSGQSANHVFYWDGALPASTLRWSIESLLTDI